MNGMPEEPDLSRNAKLLCSFERDQQGLLGIAFDPRGEILAGTGDDGTIALWDFKTGKLLQTIKGHEGTVRGVSFSQHTMMLASGGNDKTAKLWNVGDGRLLHTLEGHTGDIVTVAFDAQGGVLATGSYDTTIKLWATQTGALLHTLKGHSGLVRNVAFDRLGEWIASGSDDQTVKLWDVATGELLQTLSGHGRFVLSVAFSPDGDMLAACGVGEAVTLWDVQSGKLIRKLEGHTAYIHAVAFSHDGLFLASKSKDQTIRVWNCATWETVTVIPVSTPGRWTPALAFHPTQSLLVSAVLSPHVLDKETARQICVWELDGGLSSDQGVGQQPAPAVHYTTGKIIVVGDHSVGKSALGYRLIHGEFKEQASTHGQQFWVFPALGKRRADGTTCEAILWDFAGQPDYRLVHALFVDNADLALVLFDASNISDPLHGVGFWLKQLQIGESRCPIILVAAQTDRGTSTLTKEELEAFCQRHGIVGPISTSALTGLGLEELVEQMKSLIPWDDKPATVTTTTFKRIKDYILGLKEAKQDPFIVTPEELRARLQATDVQWEFTDAEMLTAVGHLENYGYVKRLETSKGELRILLQPERLNNLASSFVLEARRNPKGLGALEERRLLAGGYRFPELKDLTATEQDILLDSAVLLFLEHNVCFRETDPLRMEPYLVFPELINLKKPVDDDDATEDGVAYTVGGPTENVFASLVVLLGYTHTFTRTAQWQNNARYEFGNGFVCGFRQEAERDGELDFVLCFAPQVGGAVRTLFQGLFESFLARRNLTVTRFEPVNCANGHALSREIVRKAMQKGDETRFCPECGDKVTLPKMAEPIQLTRDQKAEVDSQRRAAEQRTRFEQAVFRVSAYVTEQKITPPTCFISYAWGDAEHERWVEKRLATDLQKAGIPVLLDRWHNAQIGASIARFVERVAEADRVVVVGTPLYRQKAKNVASSKGSVAAAEWDLAGIRMLATEDQKRTVLPVLLDGDESESLPPLLRGRVYGDFRNEQSYFRTAFDLILSIYQLPPNHPAVADLRESLLEGGSRLSP